MIKKEFSTIYLDHLVITIIIISIQTTTKYNAQFLRYHENIRDVKQFSLKSITANVKDSQTTDKKCGKRQRKTQVE